MTAALIPHPATSRHVFRAQVCRLIDRLITMLDEIDGDPDLEPSLGFQEARATDSQHRIIRTSPIGGVEWLDLEEQCEGEGEACEDEGAEHDGREPEEGE